MFLLLTSSVWQAFGVIFQASAGISSSGFRLAVEHCEARLRTD